MATCCNWAFNVLFSETAPLGLQKATAKFYILFVVLNLVSFLCILFFFPETKGKHFKEFLSLDLCTETHLGKSLEEMAVVFGDQIDTSDVLAAHGAKQLAADHAKHDDEKQEYS